MNSLLRLIPLFSVAAYLTLFTACKEKSDTERAGEAIEDATDGASDAVEKLGDKVEDATDGH